MLGLRPRTITDWFEGYTATKKGIRVHYPGWMHKPEGGLLSFTDLIELWFVKQFRDHGVPLHKIRSTYAHQAKELDCPHPFLRKNHWIVVGKAITTVDVANDVEAIIEPTSAQLYLDQIVIDVGNKIEFDDQDFARCWFPLGKDRPIIVDPAMRHGEPTIKGHRLGTKDVFRLWKAEEQDVNLVCEAYEITEEEARAAIEWEISRN